MNALPEPAPKREINFMNKTKLKNLLLYLVTFPTLLVGLSCVASAQSGSGNYEPPRTVDGQPDLQGVWANNTITPVERPEVFGDKALLTDDDVDFLQQRLYEIGQAGGDALFGEGVLAAAFSGEITSYDPSTGNYDSQWMSDRTIHRRTSQITDPPDGKFPPRTEKAVETFEQLRVRGIEHPADSYTDRPLSERCLSFGAPYLGSGYNSYWQIVQGRDHVAIIQEMIHDVRIVPLQEKPHIDEGIKLWHGDSRGWWEGNTLVVETTNYSEQSDYGPDTIAKTNTERFTRISATALQYEITSHDPGTYSAPYTREIIFDFSPDPIYEYACHEGNYGMTNILSGHRAEERRLLERNNAEQ